MTVLYLSEHRTLRGLPDAIARDPVPFDEQQMARMQVRRRLLDSECNETTVTLAELHAVRLVRDGVLIHDAVKAAVDRATKRPPPRTPPYKPAA